MIKEKERFRVDARYMIKRVQNIEGEIYENTMPKM